MKRPLAALVALIPTLALAHVGQDGSAHHGFLSGFTHPFIGLDHMAAMVAVGVWTVLAFRHAGRAQWVAPSAFAGLLLVGGLLAFAGLSVPGVEPMIAASLVVLGLLVATRIRMPAIAGAGVVGAFALFHGLAHGAELPADQAVAALSGMVLGTALLHVSGMALGNFVFSRHVWLPRIAGLGVALFGSALLAF
ncbi:MAG: urease accessory protein UreJ [Candidatus Dactylopiibacterium carminicum]|uniref:Urease accessory protein UreJ n=1 Tax=Candidatus Dactylopiibacterium carminicum TaxID=857335 RepID=A0A272EXE6_9RHOO|nr:HupE/UreJ family protein [Candidatus Dactylopiibacterium carminicum]KAF7600211.1 urease accessory protein UreJ [Candidatus Dactylopiibacterium carminicum]PAS94771.1 MAG: urease accessory protein UreJ [Candidatus Dactylopiibacterium carminicum]PAS97696.1 MAG: urease accessory protein UreJ [Candidatus Dactylopiibacterium carminicum]PAT00207.1 MAG: urease accessory protein UreJ [Candidatus Dactylopiibacterium carminicum]